MFEFFQGFGVTFSTMFKKVVTEEYPEDFPPAAPRYHGRHQLNRHPDGLEKCVGCELCAWACPADAIYVEGGDNTEEARYSPGERYATDYPINYLRCIFCGLCIEACPTRALTMSNEYELADDSREELIFTKEQLLAPLPDGATTPPHTDEDVAATWGAVLRRVRRNAGPYVGRAGRAGCRAAARAPAGERLDRDDEAGDVVALLELAVRSRVSRRARRPLVAVVAFAAGGSEEQRAEQHEAQRLARRAAGGLGTTERLHDRASWRPATRSSSGTTTRCFASVTRARQRLRA